MIFLLDNYDSFTFNLYQQLRTLEVEVEVARNDRISVPDVLAQQPAAIVLSPGPGRPEQAGILLELVAAARGRIPMLGVCLGMHAIGMASGGKVVSARTLMHGKACQIEHDGQTLFRTLPSPLTVMRYHSLALAASSLKNSALTISARSEDGELMALRNEAQGIESVQFHPESFATEHGPKMIANFLTHYNVA